MLFCFYIALDVEILAVARCCFFLVVIISLIGECPNTTTTMAQDLVMCVCVCGFCFSSCQHTELTRVFFFLRVDCECKNTFIQSVGIFLDIFDSEVRR